MRALSLSLMLGLVFGGIPSARADDTSSPSAAAAPAAAAPAAAAPAAKERIRVLVLDLTPKKGEEETAQVITELITVALSRRSTFDVLSSADVRSALALEAEKQALGCDDDSSCLAELAGAMGADWVLHGTVGKLGELVVVTVSLFDSEKARAVGRETIQAPRVEELPARIEEKVGSLAYDALPPRLRAKAEPPAPAPDAPPATDPVPVPDPAGGPSWALVGVGGGVAALGTAALVGGAALAFVQEGVLADPRATDKDNARLVGLGGVGLAAAGAAGLLGGLGVAAFGFME